MNKKIRTIINGISIFIVIYIGYLYLLKVLNGIDGMILFIVTLGCVAIGQMIMLEGWK